MIKMAAVNLDHVEAKKANEAKRFTYLMCKGACKEKKTDFAFTWEEFIRLVDPAVVDSAARLLKQMQKADKKALAKFKAEKAAAKKDKTEAGNSAKASKKKDTGGGDSGTGTKDTEGNNEDEVGE